MRLGDSQKRASRISNKSTTKTAKTKARLILLKKSEAGIFPKHVGSCCLKSATYSFLDTWKDAYLEANLQSSSSNEGQTISQRFHNGYSTRPQEQLCML